MLQSKLCIVILTDTVPDYYLLLLQTFHKTFLTTYCTSAFSYQYHKMLKGAFFLDHCVEYKWLK